MAKKGKNVNETKETTAAGERAAKARGGRKPAPENETKADRFKRLGSHRIGRALKAIQRVGNLASANYEYTPEQVQKLSDALTTELKLTLAKFHPKVAGEKVEEVFAL